MPSNSRQKTTAVKNKKKTSLLTPSFIIDTPPNTPQNPIDLFWSPVLLELCIQIARYLRILSGTVISAEMAYEIEDTRSTSSTH